MTEPLLERSSVGEVILYGFQGVNKPSKTYPYEVNAVLADQILRCNTEILPHVSEYKGDKIIRRLAEIPVEARRF